MWYTICMVVRMRHTRGHTRNRRSHHALKSKNLTLCKEAGCEGIAVRSHQVCPGCGMYKGRQVLKVKTKKAAK